MTRRQADPKIQGKFSVAPLPGKGAGDRLHQQFNQSCQGTETLIKTLGPKAQRNLSAGECTDVPGGWHTLIRGAEDMAALPPRLQALILRVSFQIKLIINVAVSWVTVSHSVNYWTWPGCRNPTCGWHLQWGSQQRAEPPDLCNLMLTPGGCCLNWTAAHPSWNSLQQTFGK